MSVLSRIATQIRKLRQRTCKDVVEIGRLLIEAKTSLDHGSWGQWLRTEFAWSQDTAQNFVHVYRNFKDAKSEAFRNLDVSSLYELSRPSTPEEARDTVRQLITADTPPTLEDVRKIIRSVKPTPVQEPSRGPSLRDAALIEDFKGAIAILKSLSTKPSSIFAGAVPDSDLDLIANFLRQAMKRRAA